MSRLYFNGNLKVIDYLNGEDCNFTNLNAINCTFTYPSESTQIKITYNEFESTEQIYTYIIYDYDGDTCLINGEDFSYNLDVGILPFNYILMKLN